MKNLLNIGRNLNTTELKSIAAGDGATFTRPGDEGWPCSAYECPGDTVCTVDGYCISPGGGGGGDMCPENVGMQC
ncbi:hypothetical protein [uncultured Dokdonia sp.]|uniref:hypothetical protein n=1 Tax=uncultured Dokdonia sp. TaxID=575653 RepID=UPI0026237B64|nr:hypothetical protein [uncultured Dokdonia sp.]